MEIKFTLAAWEQYVQWQGQDKRALQRINALLKDIVRGNPYEGIGKPEPLTGNLSGFWSRRIDQRHRLVYQITGEDCVVVQCKGHYDD